MNRYEEAFIVERKAVDDGHIWFDFKTVSWDQETSKHKADSCDSEIPLWAKDNPQILVVKILIAESHPDFPKGGQENA